MASSATAAWDPLRSSRELPGEERRRGNFGKFRYNETKQNQCMTVTCVPRPTFEKMSGWTASGTRMQPWLAG